MTVELFHKGGRVASHARSRLPHKHTTTPEHMPSSHRRYAEWTPARMITAAGKIGPATVALFEAILKAKRHPEQGSRACLGIICLVKSYGAERVEAAAKRGNESGATTYGSIKSILERAGTRRRTLSAPAQECRARVELLILDGVDGLSLPAS